MKLKTHPGTQRAAAAALLIALTLALAPVVAPPAAAQATKVDEIQYPPLPPFEIPEPRREELPNGLVVLLLEDHELPLVEASARIYTGSRLEPADKVGLASLTGTVLRTGGTTSRSGDELDDYLEAKAASIETSIGSESGNAFMSCLTEDFAEVLAVFADVLRHPIFDQDKLDVAKKSVEASIARQNDNPLGILFREFSQLIYGEDSPYARDTTYESLGNIGRDDLVAWHGKHLHPNRVVLGLVGDFDSDQALALVTEVFGDWSRGPEPGVVDVPYDKEPRPGVFYVEKNDMTQSNIAIGHLGVRRDNPDYYAIEVMNQVMSGSLASRFFARIRSIKGLAYSVRGNVGSDWDHDGTAVFWMTTKTETTGAGIDSLIEEARNMFEEPPTEEEVTKAKAGILNSFIFNSDSPRKILNQQLTYEYYGYPLDWLSRYRKGIEAVTTEQVRQAAERYIHPDRFSILVVGPAEGRDKPLSTWGEVTEVDITIPEPAMEKAEVSEAGARRAAELLDQAAAWMGGERLDSIASLQLEGTTVQNGPQGAMEVPMSSTFVFPDRLRQEMTLPFGTIAVVVTPEASFMQSPQGVRDLPDSMRKNVAGSMQRSPAALLKARHADGVVATVAGSGEVDGTPVELVQVEQGEEVTVLAIDPAGGRLLQLRYRGPGQGGAPGDIVETFSDFRQVEGLTYPFARLITFDGEEQGSLTLEVIRVDPPIDDALFRKPEEEGGAG